MGNRSINYFVMNVHTFRHFYDYHFAENRKIWESYVSQLSSEQFTQDVGYSHGSVRDQIVHLMSVDDTWFGGLRGAEIPMPLNPADFHDWESIRAHWDTTEQTMRDYLAALQDDMLFDTPLDGENKDLISMASAAPRGESWHRSSCPTAPITQRSGRQDNIPRLHLLCV